MTSQRAIIGMDIQKPNITIDKVKPELELDIIKPEIEIETIQPKVEIDQTEAFADAGLKNIDRFLRDMNADAKKLFLQGIERVSNQGDELSDIHRVKDDTAIANQAYQNAFGQFEYDWGYTHIPKHGPEFNPIKGEVRINFKSGEVDGNLKRGEVRTKFNRGKVETYLKQKNNLEITIVEEGVDIKV